MIDIRLTGNITPSSLDGIPSASRQRGDILCISIRTFPVDLTDGLPDRGRKVGFGRRLSRQRDERTGMACHNGVLSANSYAARDSTMYTDVELFPYSTGSSYLIAVRAGL